MKIKRRYQWLILLIVVFLLIAVLVAGQIFLRNYTVINGKIYDRNLETLDLSGAPVSDCRKILRFYQLKSVDLRGTGIRTEDYAMLREGLPDCEILWEVPFQGGYLDPATTSVTVSSLSEEDVEALRYLPELFSVDASTCQDFEQLTALQMQLPNCQVRYFVSVDGSAYPSDSETLELVHTDFAELEAAVGYLPKLRKLIFTGEMPDADTVAQIQSSFPSLEVYFRRPERDILLDPNARQVNLSGIALEPELARGLLDCYPHLEQADMVDCGLTEAQMYSICDAYPDCFFLWDIPFAGMLFRTDCTELDISGYRVSGPEEVEALLPYLPRLEKVVMCDCGLSSEQMDALNRRYEDIRFVWMVHIGMVSLRTDAIFFAPVVTGSEIYEGQTHDLMYCTDLIAIDIGHMRVSTCDWLAYMPNLQYLIIADTCISDISALAGHDKLVFLEMFQTPVKDYSPLLTCTALEDLNLCYSYGDPEPIRQMTWLKRLWWDGYAPLTKGLAECLPNTETNFESGSSTGGTWRLGARYKEQRDILGMGYLIG